MTSVQQLAREISGLKQSIKRISQGPQLAYSSIEGGAIAEYDQNGNLVANYGQQFDGGSGVMVYSAPTPPTCTVPILTGGLESVTVRWDGIFLGENGLPDITVVVPTTWTRAEVHASTVNDFTPSIDTLRATIETPQGGQVTVAGLTDVTWYFKFVCRNSAGAAGPASPQSWTSPTATVEALQQTASANGKNSNFFGPSLPAGSAFNIGDIAWIQTSEDAPITGQYAWNGTEWVAQEISHQVISSLDLGKATVGSLTGRTVQTDPGATDGIKLTTTGLTAYAASGNKSFELSAANGTLRLYAIADASLTSTGHAFQIGADTGPNLIIDTNEILGRDNGVLVPIWVNGGIRVDEQPAFASSLTRKDYVDNRTATGTVDITPVANEVTSMNVTFPVGQFTAVPTVQVTPLTTVPGVVQAWSYSNVTASGCTVRVLRSSSTETTLSWTAHSRD